MDVTVVGSGTVVPDADRVCASVHVDTGAQRLLLDCGPGAVHHMARFGVDWASLTHLALTHFHTDHVGDVPMLFFALKHALPERRHAPITVFGPPGARDLFERLATAFGDHVLQPGFPVQIRELDGEATASLGDDVSLRARPVPHTEASVAYRVHTPTASFGYTGDTAFEAGIGEFFEGVHALLAECSLPDEHAIDTHLTPSRVAALAQIARPRRLFLTHVYPRLPRDEAAERVRLAGWRGETLAVSDGFRFQVP